MKSNKITEHNHSANLKNDSGSAIVRGRFYNDLKDDFDAHIPSDGVGAFDTIDNKTNGAGVTIEGIQLIDDAISPSVNVLQKTVEVTLGAATGIVGTTAGDIGHVDGAILVAAPSSDYVLQFLSAIFVYDYDTAAYTGGADDIVVQVGGSGTQVTVSGAITGANLLEATGDKILQLGATATELLPGVGSAISIAGTALTQPGTAAGVLRCYITYNLITTGL